MKNVRGKTPIFLEFGGINIFQPTPIVQVVNKKSLFIQRTDTLICACA